MRTGSICLVKADGAVPMHCRDNALSNVPAVNTAMQWAPSPSCLLYIPKALSPTPGQVSNLERGNETTAAQVLDPDLST